MSYCLAPDVLSTVIQEKAWRWFLILTYYLAPFLLPLHAISSQVVNGLVTWRYEQEHETSDFDRPDDDEQYFDMLCVEGWVLFALNLFLFMMWFVPYLYILYFTLYLAKRRPAKSATETSTKSFQVERFGERKRRWCEECKIFKADRMCHFSDVGRCLPVFDHYCRFLGGPVYLDIMKSYVLMHLALVLHLLYLISIWSVAIWRKHMSDKFYELWAGGFLWAFFTYWVFFNLYPLIYSEWFCRGRLVVEVKKEVVFLCIEALDEHFVDYEWNTKYTHRNPWNLGFSANFQLIMGDTWYIWFAFWKPSPLLLQAELPSRIQIQPDGRVVLTQLPHDRRWWNPDRKQTDSRIIEVYFRSSGALIPTGPQMRRRAASSVC